MPKLSSVMFFNILLSLIQSFIPFFDRYMHWCLSCPFYWMTVQFILIPSEKCKSSGPWLYICLKWPPCLISEQCTFMNLFSINHVFSNNWARKIIFVQLKVYLLFWINVLNLSLIVFSTFSDMKPGLSIIFCPCALHGLAGLELWCWV